MTVIRPPDTEKARGRFLGNHALWRIGTAWVITALALVVLDAVMPGIEVDGWGSAFVAAALIGLLNALVWPLLIRVALPVTVLTLGLGVLVLNGLVVGVAAAIEPGFAIHGVLAGTVLAFGLTLVNTVLTSLFAIDDDDFYYRNVVQRQARRQGVVESSVPAIVFLEIDGLAHEVLVRAARDGSAPTIARWLRDGSHHLIRWETDWSSQTGASQTGLLHGSNEDIPAFRWWDKETGRALASSAPKDVAAIEARISDGKGLLHADGASRANMFSGDAPHSLLTMSTVLRRDRPGRIGQDYFAYFANPYNLTRTIVLAIADVVSEIWGAGQQRRLDIQPRIHRHRSYPAIRAWTTVIQRDLQVAAVIGDIYAGRPVVYTTFSGYDEVAHHSGIERPETLRVLRKLDRQFARIERAAAGAPRPVELVVLSDHGQTQGSTFLQRYGQTLEQLVREACRTDDVEATEQGDEGWMLLGASMTEAAQGEGTVSRGLALATKTRTVDDAVTLGPGRRRKKEEATGLPEVVVMASGCLGLITFPREPGRVTVERIDELYPRLVPLLRAHPGIGFLLVRSEEHGALAIGRDGIHHLDGGRVEGDDPLAPFGPNAAGKVRRTDGFPHCADIMVNSTYWDETEEVAAFEELVGSHGGMGGGQESPFVLVPAGYALPGSPLLGAGELHRWMRRWLADLGQDAYRDGAAV